MCAPRPRRGPGAVACHSVAKNIFSGWVLNAWSHACVQAIAEDSLEAEGKLPAEGSKEVAAAALA